jgi:hypothetical protein
LQGADLEHGLGQPQLGGDAQFAVVVVRLQAVGAVRQQPGAAPVTAGVELDACLGNGVEALFWGAPLWRKSRFMYMLRASILALVSLMKSAFAMWLKPQAVPNRQASAGVEREILIIVVISRIGVGVSTRRWSLGPRENNVVILLSY